MIPSDHTKIDFLYTNIGRGHPHYLDGIIECLAEDTVGTIGDVFEATTGVARLGWKAVRTAYRLGGCGGKTSALYGTIRKRTDYNRRGFMLGVLGRGLRREFLDASSALVVAHPLLAALLNGRPGLVYQHGEVVAPPESCVRGNHRVLVPLSQTADIFVEAGCSAQQLFVSGLCIEPSLVSQAEAAMNARLDRLGSNDPLCGAFFSSGAEPRIHVEKIVDAALSAVEAGGRAVVFAHESGALDRLACIRWGKSMRELIRADNDESIPAEWSGCIVCSFDSRQGLNEMTARLFPCFDYLVAPSHERTNWALGLGLPMFGVSPMLGNYAPLNLQVLLDAGVAKPLGDRQEAAWFGDKLHQLRGSGELRRMSEAGWERFDIRGFAKIAGMLGGL